MTRAHFATADLLLIGAYFAATLIVGFWRRRRTVDDYLIAERSLSLLVFTATLVATFYGGILAVGEYTYQYGLANWTTQGLPYYVFAVLFAIFLAPRVRRASHYTLPDRLAQVYGRPAAILGALFAFVIITPAPYILMVGQLTSVALGWPLLPAMLAGTILSVVYVYVGGFQSDVRINVFQFALMFLGFLVALPILVLRLGGYGWMAAHVPPTHLQLDGGQGPAFVAVWFFVALMTFVDPGFHQRCYAARTPSIAQRGILLAVLCWAIFDLLTTSTGLYARAALPNLTPREAGLAFPILAERLLPPGAKGLFYLAMLATVMSTVVSYTFIGAMTVGRDLLWRTTGEGSNERVQALTRAGLVVTTAVGFAIAWAVPSVVRQWYAIGTVAVPGLLLPVLSSYAPRFRVHPAAVLAAMTAGAGTSLACLLAGWRRHGIYADTSQFPFGTQPMYPGLAVSLAIFGVALLERRLRRA